jgi:hypothetical protein
VRPRKSIRRAGNKIGGSGIIGSKVFLLKNRRHADPPDDAPSELAALADGTLDSERRAEVEAALATSPDLAALLEEQKRALALVRNAGGAVDAPAALRARIASERRPARAPRRRLQLGVGLATAAAAALALFLALPGGAGGPSVAAAAELSTRPATGAAPTPEAAQPKLLARSVGGVPFPNWQEKFGWEASGVRTDTLGGRRTTTVFYLKEGHRLGYTIVDGASLRAPKDATLVERAGTELRTFSLHGRLVVTWLRGGRTCVLSASGVARGVLLKLAAWNGKGSIPF